jgi:DNA-binding NarL/FixJ family response regulator
VRDGVMAVLAQDPSVEVVASLEDGEQALAAIEKERPDVAVLDISMPGLTGIEVVRKARDQSIRTAILLLSVHKEQSFVTSALQAGASGYVIKDAAARELLDAIKVVAGGDVYLSPAVAGAVVEAMRSPSKKSEPQLTPRERDVLRLVAEGLTSKEVATKLGITRKTVEGHRAAIMDKLAVRHVAGLTKYAIRHHLTTL